MNTYNGQERPAVKSVSIRPAGYSAGPALREKALYEGLKRGESSDETAGWVFTRDDLSPVFRYLRDHTPFSMGSDVLLLRLGNKTCCWKVLAALDILQELGLAQIQNDTIEILPAAGKADLTSSQTYQILQQRLVNRPL